MSDEEAESLTSFGQAIGAVLAGVVFDLTDSYELAFAILSGLAMLLVLFAQPPRRAAPE